jgi:hypothetical protein
VLARRQTPGLRWHLEDLPSVQQWADVERFKSALPTGRAPVHLTGPAMPQDPVCPSRTSGDRYAVPPLSQTAPARSVGSTLPATSSNIRVSFSAASVRHEPGQYRTNSSTPIEENLPTMSVK